MRTIIYATLIYIALIFSVWGAEPQATTEVLELRRALIECQMQTMASNFPKMQEQLQQLQTELDKRKTTETKKPETK